MIRGAASGRQECAHGGGPMQFFADLHVHSKHSRATSRDCDLEHLAWWAARKGIAVVGTGDFTHPAWFDELQKKLRPAEPGLFRLEPELERAVLRTLPPACQRPVRFLLQVEISTIYKKADATRKIHHLVYAPDFESAGRIRRSLGAIGNIASDGRPILGLDSRHLLEIVLQSGAGSYLIPAHIWTPWFAVLGSKSGFDAVQDCYADLAPHIFAVETGLSSDPSMNWRVSSLDGYALVSSSDAHSPPMLGREASLFDTELDYFALRRALETRAGYVGTVEFFPEEGKYHLDGHRKCDVRLEPPETQRLGGRCPRCAGPLTVGVMHRVEHLADRPDGARPARASGYQCLVPLPEILGEIHGVGARSKSVARELAVLIERLGPELSILREQPLEAIARGGSTLLAEAIARLRRGDVRREAGYDGEYGTIRMFDEAELRWPARAGSLFPARESEPRHAETDDHDDEGAHAPPALEEMPCVTLPSTPELPFADGGLSAEQRAVVEALDGPVLVVAGPGAGKTRTLVARIAHAVRARGEDPEGWLALTFSRRAAEELRERIETELGPAARRVTATTFHALGHALLHELRGELGLSRSLRIASEIERIELARELFAESATAARRRLEELSRLRRTGGPLSDDVARYRSALWERDWLDFDALIELPVELLEREPRLRDALRARYRRVCVDEFQDVDPLQYRLLRALVPADGHLCAVGDPDQAIYGFRGADVEFFLHFERDFPGARRLELRHNYRSSPTIVQASLEAIAPASALPGRELRAVRPAAGAAPIVLHEAASERAEAEFVAHSIEQRIGGTSLFSFDSGRTGAEPGDAASFADFAVLYRTDAQSRALVEALERSGIPFQKRSHDRLLERPGVARLARALEARAGASDPVRPLLDRLAQTARELVASEAASAAELADCVDLLGPLAHRCGSDVARLLLELELGAEVDSLDPRADRVSLLTLHAAKGLEFPIVFVTGCEDGLLPLRFERGDAGADALAEERRLFFVGMTRAGARLYLTRARQRTWRGQSLQPEPSPFLAPIAAAHVEHSQTPARPRAPARGRQLELW
jgi:DNA helicase II / ATP-dependent DNA helicase PcrA